ncbi:MAG TPA: ABC transporter permease [Acidimicrobiia bacterium]|nr:ABC transporter permease [Acidimicrobiia bacterium]
MTTTRQPSAALTSLVVSSRFVPVYIALALLVVVAWIWAPQTLSSVPLRAIAPYGAVLGVAALGQMLVIMTGGIDLSVPGTMSLAAVIMVGVGAGADENLGRAVAIALAASAIVGLFNGILIGGLKLNPLIVTLAVGSIVTALVFRYANTFTVQNPVPGGLTAWTTNRIWGLSAVFWLGLAVTVIVSLVLRYTTAGRRFQVVGANPVAANVLGVRVTTNQVMAYVFAALLYAAAAIALAGLLRRPGASVGTQYLLAPIAAVVIGGASLTGGLASAFSTFTAGLFLTGLNQMMLTMGLPTSLQFVVFGLVIIAGMLVSGDRITKGVEQLLRERRRPTRSEVEEILTPMNE